MNRSINLNVMNLKCCFVFCVLLLLADAFPVNDTSPNSTSTSYAVLPTSNSIDNNNDTSVELMNINATEANSSAQANENLQPLSNGTSSTDDTNHVSGTSIVTTNSDTDAAITQSPSTKGNISATIVAPTSTFFSSTTSLASTTSTTALPKSSTTSTLSNENL